MSEIHKIKGELREHDAQTAIYRDPNGKTSIFGRALEALVRQERSLTRKDGEHNELKREIHKLKMLLVASRDALVAFEDERHPRSVTLRYENADHSIADLKDYIRESTKDFVQPAHIAPHTGVGITSREFLGVFLHENQVYDLYLEPNGVVARYGDGHEDAIEHAFYTGFYTDRHANPKPDHPPLAEAIKRAEELDFPTPY